MGRGQSVMKPLIGICSEFEEWHSRPGFDAGYLKLYHYYYHAVTRAGGLPLVIPVLEDPALALELIARCHGVLMTGGDDLRPPAYGAGPHPAVRVTPPWRQRQDLLVARHLLDDSRKPVLAICMGAQTLAVASGGSLVQDIPSEVGRTVTHAQGAVHPAEFVEGSRLVQWFGRRAMVNSFHHQSIANLGTGLQFAARAPDGVAEAIEGTDPSRFLVGVQWHPERDRSRESGRMFSDFVAESSRSRD